MQVNVETTVEIDAPAELVWSVLLDFGSYIEWNPFVVRIQGPTIPGERLLVSIRQAGGRTMTFRPRVLSVTGGRELRWLGRLVIPGLFDGEHYFKLEAIGASRVRFIHGEVFSGILVGLAKHALLQSTRTGFDAMNQALRQHVESRRGTTCSPSSMHTEVRRSMELLASA